MTMFDPNTQQHQLDALLRTEFEFFTEKVFATLNAGHEEPYIDNWHIDAVCHALEEARLGRSPKAVINLPPRHSKSTIAAVAFTAWLLGQNPKAEIIVASHTQRLARAHSEQTRTIMDAGWYKRLFPQTRIAEGSSRAELRTTEGGQRMAVTPGVATMGFGADAIIIDDLLDAMEARSETERQKVIDYIDNALLTRINKPAKSLVVCIHRRLHESDPAGHLLDTGAYAHLKLTAIAEEDEDIATGPGKVHHRKKGTALFPQRYGLSELQAAKKQQGPAVFHMLFQQNPIAAGGSALQWDWFGTYDEVLPRTAYEMLVQSWDTGSSANPDSAFSVCTTWGFRERKWHLLDVFREQVEYPALKRACLRLVEKWDPDRVLIEDASSGRQLLQECRDMDRARYVPIRPKLSKDERFETSWAPVEEGLILLPREAPWLADFKQEMLGFPRATRKDQVDSFSQFVNWTTGVGFWRALSREHPMSLERQKAVERNREEQRKRL